MCNTINYQIISIEEQELWSLKEVKNYLRVSHENDDKLITNLIHSAVVYAEQFLGIRFFVTKLVGFVDKSPSYLRLKYRPIVINKVFHIVNEEEKQDITKEFGYVDYNNEKVCIAQKFWNKRLEINYEAGLGDKIPKPVLQGILMHIGMMYDFSENSTSIFSEVKEIYLPYRYLKI